MRDYKLLYKERLDKSRLGASCLYRKHHELDAGDVNTPSSSEINQSGELLGENLVGIIFLMLPAPGLRHQETWRVLLELREQGEELELGRF